MAIKQVAVLFRWNVQKPLRFFSLKPEPNMNHKHSLIASLLALAGLGAAHAADVGQHPALFSPRGLHTVEPSTSIVGHPASPAWRRSPANHEHPAVSKKWAKPALDTDHYLVQPPASTRWSVPARDQAMTLARRPTILR